MTAEIMATLFTGLALLVSLIGGMVTVLAWGHKQIEKVDAGLRAEMRSLEERVNGRMDGFDEKLSELQHDVTDIKIAVARLEGPTPPHLILARR